MHIFSSKQGIVNPNSEVAFLDFDNADWLILLIDYIYNYADLIPFVLIWGATALLLLYYRKKLGLVKFWIMISLPLVYYLGTFIDIIGLYDPQSDPDSFFLLSVSLS